MDIKEFLRVVRARWTTVAVLVALGIGAALAITAVSHVTYTATTELFVSIQGSSGSATEIGQGNNAAQQKTRSYASVVRSARVLQPVIAELHLDETPRELAGRVTAASPQSTVLLTVSVVDADPDRAAAVANAIGASFREVVTEHLEKPVDGGPSLVRIETTDPALPPTTPSSPRRTVNLALGLAGGLIGGVALALLRHATDTRVRSSNDVRALSHAPILGEISFDPNAASEPLIVQAGTRSPAAEAFRGLRTNLLFVEPDRDRCTTVVITSAMPGEGKTTTTANLAVALAESGARVALVDADLRRPRVAEVMGIEGSVGLTELLVGRAELDDVIQPWGRNGLLVLPAGATPPNPSELLGSRAMRALIDDLETRVDYLLIDSPPLLPVTDAAVLSKLGAGAVVVAAAGRSRHQQLVRALGVLETLDSRPLGIVLTMLRRSGADPYGYGYGYGEDDDARAGIRRRRRRVPRRRRGTTETR